MRLLIVSNRLPVTVEEKKGELVIGESAGGLVSGLKTYLTSLGPNVSQSKYLWVGWPGGSVSEQKQGELKSRLLDECSCHPVNIPKEDMDLFYFGFCNRTLWPLFHYFPVYTVYDESYWDNYRKINMAFCEAVLQVIKPGDVVWIHDYHLMLLPKMLRDRVPGLSIGFFLHIPFPSFELFHMLPRKWRQEIMEGLLGADLYGFHTHDYTQHFLRSVLRVTGNEHNMGQFTLHDRIVKADTFPMGIDYRRYNEEARSQAVQKEKESMKSAVGDAKVVLSMDRLDYSKGILNRLKGYQRFLETNPCWHKKVVLFLVVVPSRTGVEKYQQIKRQIDERVGNINGKYGSPGWTPIIYQYKYFGFVSLSALYSISDVALVTPLRDGMNLVSKEYVASRTDGLGVLVLSEMAGSSKELGEAVIINPNNIEEIAEAIKEALEMPLEEQRRRIAAMQKRIARYDINRWGNDFLSQLSQIKEEQKKFNARMLSNETINKLLDDYSKSKKRLFLLDYDGTLVPFTEEPVSAVPSDELIKILRSLSEDQRNEVFLISGRDKNILEQWFGGLNIGIVAEHGVWFRNEKSGKWKTARNIKTDWKKTLRPLLETYADRLPGSFIEEKDYSLVFHYRKADPELGSMRAKELRDTLINLTANLDVQILQGSKVVEVKSSSVTKGSAVSSILHRKEYGFILSVGDDWTDEEMFKALPKTAYSIRVGINPSYSRFNLHNDKEVLRLLSELVKKR